MSKPPSDVMKLRGREIVECTVKALASPEAEPRAPRPNLVPMSKEREEEAFANLNNGRAPRLGFSLQQRPAFGGNCGGRSKSSGA